MNQTLHAFRNDISNADKIKKRILENIETKDKEEMVLNTVQLRFDFLSKNVEISYYRIDDGYPDVHLGFDVLKEMMLCEEVFYDKRLFEKRSIIKTPRCSERSSERSRR